MALPVDPITHPNAFISVVFAGSLRTPGKCTVTGWNRENEYDIKTGKGTAGATETLKGQPPAKGKITFWAWTPAHFAAWTPILAALKFDPAKSGNGNNGAATPAASGTATTPTPSFEQGGTGGGGTAALPEPGNTTGKTKDEDSDNKGKSDSQPALTKAAAIDIYHPVLADIGVSSVLPPEKLGIWEQDGEASGLWKRDIDFVEFTQPPSKSIAATPTGSSDKPANGADGQPAGSSDPPAAEKSTNAASKAAAGAQGAWGAP